jgi:hypothetical protein
VSHKLDLPYSDLSLSGSSIIWQSDQICRSDLRFGDIVFWGVTGPHRVPLFDNGEIIHMHAHTHSYLPELRSKFSIELIDNDTLLYHNVLAIRRAYHFCQKIGAKIVMLGLVNDHDSQYLHYRVPVFRLLKPIHQQWVDRGTDNMHPGPEQHKIFAQEFVDFYNQLYN